MKNTPPQELPKDTVAISGKPKKDYVEIRLPKLHFKDTSINTYLVFVLIVFAFLLGMLTNKVLYLEKAAKTATVPSQQLTDNQANANNVAEPTPPEVVKVDNGKLPLLGDPNAKVTVVEFSDFQCPFCERAFTSIISQLNENYIKTGKVKLAYRHFPLYSIHPSAEKAAIAAECANEQSKFWDYHDILFKNLTSWSQQTGSDLTNSFSDYASQLSLDATQFRACLDTDKYKSSVTADAKAGEAVQVEGTPTFFVNGKRIVGAVPFSEIQSAIEAELKK